MKKDTNQLRNWTKPEFKRLGKIADVAGASNRSGQTINQVATKT